MALFRKVDPRDTFVAAANKTLRNLGISGSVDFDPELFAFTSIIQSLMSEELFVASSMPAERDGRLVSVATWIDGPSITPEVDQVLFFKSEQENWMVAWDDVATHLGHLMQPTNFYPPRYRVEEFPPPEEIDAMPQIAE